MKALVISHITFTLISTTELRILLVSLSDLWYTSDAIDWINEVEKGYSLSMAQKTDTTPTQQRRTTMADVAKLAGVSVMTVSRVLNDGPHVVEEKTEKVREAIAKLNYVPSISGRRLASRCSYVLGVVYAPDKNTGSWIADTQKGLQAALAREAYEATFFPCKFSDSSEQQEILQRIEMADIDGLMLLPPYGGEDAFVRRLMDRNLPLVQLEPPNLRLPKPAVHFDNRQGALDMTQYLIACGHRRIGFVMGDTYHRASYERFDGYRDALERNEVIFDPALVAQGDHTFESGIAGGHALLQGDTRPTAIFASNDEMAAGVLNVAHKMKLSVPEELSIAGFDDVSWARKLTPALTTVLQPRNEMANLATELLIRQLKQEENVDDVSLQLPTKLIVRESTAKLG